jgi:hypothetical protein
MTDTGNLHGIARLNAQINKSFAADGRCIIMPLEQITRMNDKLEQLEGDVHALGQGMLPLRCLPTQIEPAERRGYVKNLPLARINDGAFIREYNNYIADMRSKLTEANCNMVVSRCGVKTVNYG